MKHEAILLQLRSCYFFSLALLFSTTLPAAQDAGAAPVISFSAQDTQIYQTMTEWMQEHEAAWQLAHAAFQDTSRTIGNVGDHETCRPFSSGIDIAGTHDLLNLGSKEQLWGLLITPKEDAVAGKERNQQLTRTLDMVCSSIGATKHQPQQAQRAGDLFASIIRTTGTAFENLAEITPLALKDTQAVQLTFAVNQPEDAAYRVVLAYGTPPYATTMQKAYEKYPLWRTALESEALITQLCHLPSRAAMLAHAHQGDAWCMVLCDAAAWRQIRPAMLAEQGQLQQALYQVCHQTATQNAIQEEVRNDDFARATADVAQQVAQLLNQPQEVHRDVMQVVMLQDGCNMLAPLAITDNNTTTPGAAWVLVGRGQAPWAPYEAMQRLMITRMAQAQQNTTA